jgi:hypothetical protein
MHGRKPLFENTTRMRQASLHDATWKIIQRRNWKKSYTTDKELNLNDEELEESGEVIATYFDRISCCSVTK